MGFEERIEPPGDAGEKHYWFAFQDNRLLVSASEDGAAIPLAGQPDRKSTV